MAPLSAPGEMPESAANFRAKARLPQAVPAWPHRAGREVPAILRGVVPTSLAIRATGAVPWRADGALAELRRVRCRPEDILPSVRGHLR